MKKISASTLLVPVRWHLRMWEWNQPSEQPFISYGQILQSLPNSYPTILCVNSAICRLVCTVVISVIWDACAWIRLFLTESLFSENQSKLCLDYLFDITNYEEWYSALNANSVNIVSD